MNAAMMFIIILLTTIYAAQTRSIVNSQRSVGSENIEDLAMHQSPALPAGQNRHYPGNRPPLTPSPLIKLPIGAITPEGWLQTQLVLMKDGFVGHLDELSRFVRYDSGWMNNSSSGWEELPYWLKGFGDLGYVLDDPEIIAKAKRWIDAAVESQQIDGYFGPADNKVNRDAWPNMIMLCALRSRYEATGDERMIPMITRYMRYLYELPPGDLLPYYWGEGKYRKEWWQSVRAGDLLESIYWLYNRTGDRWLLELSARVYEKAARWQDGVVSHHGVNICQGFRCPAVWSQQSGDGADRAASEVIYAQIIDEYGQVPGGMFGADENCRGGYVGPRQAAETCSMVEMMHSQQTLLKISGDAVHAGRCEDVALNSLPASMTADLKGLHYLTAPNMVQLDRHNKAPGIQNGGTMLSYDPWRYRCCQHNVAQGWPYYAEHLWLATAGDGLAAVFYAPCHVTAKVGDGVAVTIREDTDYPFDESVRFELAAQRTVEFPLSLRIPGWCEGATISINGRLLEHEITPGGFATITRTWSNGDKVLLTLPMAVCLRAWEKNPGSVCVYRGPLAYSLKIGERWSVCGGTDRWPAYEVHPTTPWNYALVLDDQESKDHLCCTTASFTVIRRMTASALPEPQPLPDQPFDVEAVPVTIWAKGKRIPAWQLDHLGLIGELQPCPARVDDAPPEDITLIPMGCARLRVSVFPVASSSPAAHDWIVPDPE